MSKASESKPPRSRIEVTNTPTNTVPSNSAIGLVQYSLIDMADNASSITGSLFTGAIEQDYIFTSIPAQGEKLVESALLLAGQHD